MEKPFNTECLLYISLLYKTQFLPTAKSTSADILYTSKYLWVMLQLILNMSVNTQIKKLKLKKNEVLINNVQYFIPFLWNSFTQLIACLVNLTSALVNVSLIYIYIL